MADVYKFRLTIDLAVATHESARAVRDYLKATTDHVLREQQRRVEHNHPVDAVLAFDVRAKRLDDAAAIGAPLRLVSAMTCPHCTTELRDVAVYQLPFTCPVCGKTIRIEANGRLIT